MVSAAGAAPADAAHESRAQRHLMMITHARQQAEGPVRSPELETPHPKLIATSPPTPSLSERMLLRLPCRMPKQGDLQRHAIGGLGTDLERPHLKGSLVPLGIHHMLIAARVQDHPMSGLRGGRLPMLTGTQSAGTAWSPPLVSRHSAGTAFHRHDRV